MENLMLNFSRTEVKIVDFGLSNTYSNSNPLQTHCGSPEYAAPELFVEGRRYGPEVDLWSLGVILYGMVIGELPFISNKDKNITAQQRRKKLIDQINKGMGVSHLRALMFFSEDFKSMMSKLLVADCRKRITVRNLMFHPWVTDKGCKNIRSNRFKRLDIHSKSLIIKNISSILHLSNNEIKLSMKSESQGSISGIYNILAYKLPQQMAEGRNIIGISSEHGVNYATPRPQMQTKTYQKFGGEKLYSYRKTQQINSAPVRKIFRPTPPVLLEKSKGEVLRETTRNYNLCEEKQFDKHNVHQLNNNSTLTRSSSDFTDSFSRKRFVNDTKAMDLSEENMVSLKSYLNLEKRKKSAKLLENTTQTNPPEEIARRKAQPSNLPGKETTKITMSQKVTQKVSSEKIMTQKLLQRVTNHDKISNVIANKRTLSKTSGNIFKRKPTGNLLTNKTSSSGKNDTNKSESILNKRRCITMKSNSDEKPNKTPSKLASSTGESNKQMEGAPQSVESKNTNKSRVCQKVQPMPKHDRLQVAKDDMIAKCIQSSLKNKFIRPLVSEPIAKSIADYVVNNIPCKAAIFRWIDTTKRINGNSRI